MTDTTSDRLTALNERPTPVKRVRRGRKLSVRAAIGITLIVVWTLDAATGFLLYVAPSGRRSGQQELLLGITKQAWGDIHWWLSVAAIAVTVVHVAVDWRTFRACVRHLAHRSPACQPAP